MLFAFSLPACSETSNGCTNARKAILYKMGNFVLLIYYEQIIYQAHQTKHVRFMAYILWYWWSIITCVEILSLWMEINIKYEMIMLLILYSEWKLFWNFVFQKSIKHSYKMWKYDEFVLEWCSLNYTTDKDFFINAWILYQHKFTQT